MSAIFSRGDRFSPLNAEKYRDFPFALHEGAFSPGVDRPIHAHFHREIELIAVTEGSLSLRVSGSTVSLSDGEGILLNAEQIHRIDPSATNACRYLCISFLPELLTVNQAFADAMLTPWLGDGALPHLKLRADRYRHREIYEKIRWIHRMEREELAPLWILAAIAEIWANFCDNTEAPALSPKEVKNAKEARGLMNYLREHCAERLTLPSIAASAGMGQSKCCKLFATFLGESPIEYLTRCRLEKGAQMLVETDASATEIAHACGFGGGSYFAEAFRAHYGISPTAYRHHENL